MLADTLMAQLEAALGFGKHAWPVSAVRPLADVLLDGADGRQISPRHEARWLNLFGYCLRPGFGATLDEHRMTRARRLYLAGLAFPADVQCQAEWLVLWQRLAGGFTPGQQQELFDRVAAQLGLGREEVEVAAAAGRARVAAAAGEPRARAGAQARGARRRPARAVAEGPARREPAVGDRSRWARASRSTGR